MSLTAEILNGNRLALAKLLTQIENDSDDGEKILNELFSYTGHAYIIGVTGAPGTGKSTLVNQLARYYRSLEEQETGALDSKTVAIIAVDPTSPFSGGAILGDRVRMRDLTGDPGVFIRSMASRGALGGLATKTIGFVDAFDAAGYEVIFIETVGAGQAEVDIARVAHTTMVVEAPGMGDDIQAIKAGILEIADILVVNKADRPGADVTERALRNMLQLSSSYDGLRLSQSERLHHHEETVTGKNSPQVNDKNIWHVPIVQTIATEGYNIDELAEAIEKHRQFLKKSNQLRMREKIRLRTELELIVQEYLDRRWRERISDEEYNKLLNRLIAREISIRDAAEYLLEE